MNVCIQYCGLVNMILLLLIFMTSKRLKIRSEKMFVIMLSVTTACLIFDISSIYAIAYLDRASLLLPAICKLYLCSLICEGASGFLYVVMDCSSLEQFKQVHLVTLIVMMVEDIAVVFLPIAYYCENGQIYTYDLAVQCTYYFTIPFVLATIVVTVVFRNKINRRRLKAVAAWMSLWFVASVIQYLNNELLLVGFACSLGMIIIFVMLENPEGNYDRQFGFFNSYALGEFLKQRYATRETFGAIVFLLPERIEQDPTLLKSALGFLQHYKGMFVFRRGGAEIVAAYSHGLEARNVADAFDSRFRSVIHDYNIVLIPDAHLLESNVNLFNVVESAKAKLSHMSRKYRFDVTRDVIADYFHKGQVEQEIISAIAEDRVDVYLQPIFSCKTGGFASAEALVRIHKRDGSMLFPGSFIPVAEETGRIVEIGDIVFDKTCAFLKEYRDKLGLKYIEINLSVVQCEKTNLADKIIETIEKYEIDPSWINLEITESAAIAHSTLFMGNMRKLLDYGVTFSLDDFGKGESNLMYLIEMPVSIVKFDIDMMKSYHSDAKAHQVIDAAIAMVHSIGLHIVAEGIETADEMEDTRKNGIDYIQGYYFSKPLPMDTFAGFVRGKI